MINDKDRRIAATLGEATALLTGPGNYEIAARTAFNQHAARTQFTDRDRAELSTIFAEGLTAVTTPGAAPSKLEPVVNLTFDQVQQGMRRYVTEYHKDGKRTSLKTVRQLDFYETMRGDDRPRGYVRYTDGTDEYMGPGTSWAFLADTVPGSTKQDWTRHNVRAMYISVGQLHEDGRVVREVVIHKTHDSTTYDIRYADTEDAGLNGNDLVPMRFRGGTAVTA